MYKIKGTGTIDFPTISKILVLTVSLYALSAVLSFIQGWIMTGITQKIVYSMRRDISEKINRMPMKYFESHQYGDVLSRITNDVDTLGTGLNQSVTTIITSIATDNRCNIYDVYHFSTHDTDFDYHDSYFHSTTQLYHQDVAEAL